MWSFPAFFWEYYYTSLHILDRSSTKNYDLSLKDQLEVIIIEQVDVTGIGQDTQSRLRKCKEREWFWQNNLRTLQQYGGMNVREERSSTWLFVLTIE